MKATPFKMWQDTEHESDCIALPSASRSDAFGETLPETLRRWLLALLWPLRPSRILDLPNAAWLICRDLLNLPAELPDPHRALDRPAGLAGLARDLSPSTIESAYRRGLYPFAHVGPQKWWSPVSRWVLRLDELRINRIPRLRRCRHTVTFDTAFETVIRNCAAARPGQWPLTWITPAIMRAYSDAFDAGHVHSIEVWDERKRLIGGLYGVAAGASFSIESLFSHEPGASRVGLLVLAWHLRRWGYTVLDAKLTNTWKEMGFKEIGRTDYIAMANASEPPPLSRRWHAHDQLQDILDAVAGSRSRVG